LHMIEVFGHASLNVSRLEITRNLHGEIR
jgi:hypothetical protein